MQRNYILQNSVLAFDTNCCFKKLEIPNSGQCVLHLVEVVGGKWWPSLVGWWRTHTPLCSLPTQPAPHTASHPLRSPQRGRRPPSGWRNPSPLLTCPTGMPGGGYRTGGPKINVNAPSPLSVLNID